MSAGLKFIGLPENHYIATREYARSITDDPYLYSIVKHAAHMANMLRYVAGWTPIHDQVNKRVRRATTTAIRMGYSLKEVNNAHDAGMQYKG
jgi:hypothetical protein